MIEPEARLARIVARARIFAMPEEVIDALKTYLSEGISRDEMTSRWRAAFGQSAIGSGLSCLAEEFEAGGVELDRVERRAIALVAAYPDIYLTNFVFSLSPDRAWEPIGAALVEGGVPVELLLEHCFARASGWTAPGPLPSPLGALVLSRVSTHFEWMCAFVRSPCSTVHTLAVNWARDAAQLPRSLFDLLLVAPTPDIDRAEQLARAAPRAYLAGYVSALLGADSARFLPWARELTQGPDALAHAGLLFGLSEAAPAVAAEFARALIDHPPWRSSLDGSQYVLVLRLVARDEPARALPWAEELARWFASADALDLLESLDGARCESVLTELAMSETPQRAAFALKRLFARSSDGYDALAWLAVTHGVKPIRDIARAYLAGRPESVVLALAPVLEHAPLDARLTLVELLGASGGSHGRELLREHLATERSARVRKAVLSAVGTEGEPSDGAETPAALLAAAEEMKKHLARTPVAWFDHEHAPSLAWADGSAAPSVVGAYLLQCQSGQRGLELDPRIAPMVHGLDASAKSVWAAALLTAWERAGSEARFTWCLVLAAAMSAPATAAFLTEAIERWAIKRRAMAVQGVQVLAMMGTDEAMHFLSRMTDAHAGTLGLVAEAALEAEAGARAISRDELADAVVPRFHFDASRRWRPLFGARRFEVELADDFLLNVRDEKGREIKGLPKPGAKDDPALSGTALLAWKSLRAGLGAVVERELSRMERALTDGRRWRAAQWLADVVAHPILGVLASRLVWRSDEGRTVRAEGGRCVGHDSRIEAINGHEIMQLLHPVEVSHEVCAAWIESFTERLIRPPFEQCSREVFRVDAPERAEISQRKVRGRWMSAGPSTRKGLIAPWVREGFSPLPTVHSQCQGFERRFPLAGVVAVLEVSGIGLWRETWQETELLELKFTTVEHVPLALGEVPPRAYSEAMRSVQRMGHPRD